MNCSTRWFTAYSLLMPCFCIVTHNNQGILQALASRFSFPEPTILLVGGRDRNFLCKRKTSRDVILAQNFRLTEVSACVIHELFECIIRCSIFLSHVGGSLCILRNSANVLKRIYLRGMHKLTLIVNNHSAIFVLKCNVQLLKQ